MTAPSHSEPHDHPDGRHPVVTSQHVAQTLHEAGVIPQLDYVTRVTITLGPEPMDPPLILVELLGDDRLNDLAAELTGAKTVTAAPGEAEPGSS